jgi:hypothetical protein
MIPSYTFQLHYRESCPLTPGDMLASGIEDGLGYVHFFSGDAIVDFIERAADPCGGPEHIVATVDVWLPEDYKPELFI